HDLVNGGDQQLVKLFQIEHGARRARQRCLFCDRAPSPPNGEKSIRPANHVGVAPSASWASRIAALLGRTACLTGERASPVGTFGTPPINHPGVVMLAEFLAYK